MRNVPVRAPHLHAVLRAFCLAGFAELGPGAAQAVEVPFVVDEHSSGFYEYRPLVRDHVQARAVWLAELPDARIAVDELRREPAAAIFAGAHAGPESEQRALFRAILLPLLGRTAQACGGFDWDDGAFERVYAELERSLFGSSPYYAVAPLVGLSAGAPLPLTSGIRVDRSSGEELARSWPEAGDLLPARFGLEPERACMLVLERELPGDEHTAPDAPAELADAITALRLATGASIAAGPVVFERLDWHPLGLRSMLGIAAAEPAGEPTRLDPWRGRLAGELLERIVRAEQDAELAEAIERWELSLFEEGPLRSERLRESLVALLGGGDGLWAATMRGTVLLGEPSRARSGLIEQLRALAAGASGEDEVADAVRRAVVEVMLHEDRAGLLALLDDALLGLRARPAGYFSTRAASPAREGEAFRRSSGTAA
jgi:hypothetical protein